jgi:hypothetical protein
MLVDMTTSLHLLVNDSIHDPGDVSPDDGIPSPLHLPVNDGIHDPSDVGPDDGIPSLACE